MSRQVSIVALVLLAVLGSLALAAAAERKEAGGKAKSPPAAAEPTTAPPKQITNSIGMKLTLVPSGVFMMGGGVAGRNGGLLQENLRQGFSNCTLLRE